MPGSSPSPSRRAAAGREAVPRELDPELGPLPERPAETGRGADLLRAGRAMGVETGNGMAGARERSGEEPRPSTGSAEMDRGGGRASRTGERGAARATTSRHAEAPRTGAAGATAVAVSGPRVLVGWADGSVGVMVQGEEQARLAPPTGVTGPVRCVAEAGGATWWLAGAETAALLTDAGGAVRAVETGGEQVDRIAAFGRGLLLISRQGVRRLDPETGAIGPAPVALPPDSAGARCASVLADGMLGFVSDAGVLNVVRLSDGAWQVEQTAVLPASGGAPGRLSLSTRDAWMVTGRAVVRFDRESGAADAYLPWNDGAARPTDVAADGQGGAWVATAAGLRRIRPGGPDGERGYDGFVRAPLGDAAGQPAADWERALAMEIDAWQGVPYLYGGSSRQGTDCSGFVMSVFGALGVRLPHGSAELRGMAEGAVVRDELRYGDVLTYPGHCAIYTGAGTTAETVTGGVGRGTVWRRTDVVVRRYAAPPAGVRGVLSSRGGRRGAVR